MSVDNLSKTFCNHQFVKHFIISLNDTNEIHKFSETENVRELHRSFHRLSVDNSARMFKRCRRYTGRKHVFNTEGCILGSIHHIVQAVDTCYIDDLMRVRNNRGRSQRDNQLAEFFRRKM